MQFGKRYVLFVKREDSKLRVMFDTRRGNMQFHAPPLVRLASRGHLSDVEFSGYSLHVAQTYGECCHLQY